MQDGCVATKLSTALCSAYQLVSFSFFLVMKDDLYNPSEDMFGFSCYFQSYCSSL